MFAVAGIKMMAVVTHLLVALALFVALRNFAFGDRCIDICSKEDFNDQCRICLGRVPVRFGKRSSPDIQRVVMSSSWQYPPPPRRYLLTYRLRNALHHRSTSYD